MTETFTYNDLREFIFSQQDERIVNMHEPGFDVYRQCGCVLAQFGKSKFPECSNYAGWTTVSACYGSEPPFQLEGEDKVRNIIRFLYSKFPTNYKQVKEFVLQFEADQS